MENRTKKIVFIVVAIIAVLFVGLIVSRVLQSKLFAEKKGEEVKRDPVTVVKVGKNTIRKTLFYTGDLHAEREVNVHSVVTGKVIRYNYSEGDRVWKGSTLALLERTETWDEFKPVVVESPISGIIAINYLDKGELATPQTPITMVVGGKGIKVAIKVTDIELGMIKKGMKSELRVPPFPNKLFIGEVSKVSPVIRRETRTAPVEILFENRDRMLLSGMFGDIRIVVETKENVIVVPYDALLFEKEGKVGPYCFVLEGEKIVKKRNLKIGMIEGESVEVVEGLMFGDLVIDLGKESLKDGDEVVVVDK